MTRPDRDEVMSPAEWLADSEVALRPDEAPETASAVDPWGEAVAAFLADLLDNVQVAVVTDGATSPVAGVGRRIPEAPVFGADGRSRQFLLESRAGAVGERAGLGPFPLELADLPGASLRALARITRSPSTTELVYPSLAKALHDVVIAEVLADRLSRRTGRASKVDEVASLVANTLDYFTELAATRHEGEPVSHGVVIASDPCGLRPIESPVRYPGRFPTRKRTPLLFDGTESLLVIDSSGDTLGSVTRESLARSSPEAVDVKVYDEFPGLDGALTAAASEAFNGVGVHLRADQSVWIFDSGKPLFIRRTSRWKSIAIESFIRVVGVLGETATPEVAERIVRAALRTSIQGHGALFAIAADPAALDVLVQPRDRYATDRSGVVDRGARSVDDELHRLIPVEELGSSGLLARLARIDGATIVDTTGDLLAYGAVVRSTDGRGEGARTAAARALSAHAHVAIAVSQDGPITLFHDGETAFEVL